MLRMARITSRRILGRSTMAVTAEVFSRQLRAAGFRDIVLVERQPDGALDEHSHPFESKALILSSKLALLIAVKEPFTGRRYFSSAPC
jgi:hypothetical protein